MSEYIEPESGNKLTAEAGEGNVVVKAYEAPDDFDPTQPLDANVYDTEPTVQLTFSTKAWADFVGSV